MNRNSPAADVIANYLKIERFYVRVEGWRLASLENRGNHN